MSRRRSRSRSTRKRRSTQRNKRRGGEIKPYKYTMNDYIRNDLKYPRNVSAAAPDLTSAELEDHMARQHGFVNQLTAHPNQNEIQRLEAELQAIRQQEAEIQRRINMKLQINASIGRRKAMEQQLAAMGK